MIEAFSPWFHLGMQPCSTMSLIFLIKLLNFSGDEHVSKLQHLDISFTLTTDKILPKLATSLPLKYLRVVGTKVTEAGAESIKGLRPKCEVVF